MNQNIFRAYDIRGIYPDELNEETAKNIGRAFASYIRRKYKIDCPRIIVGKDNRTHGPKLQDAFVDGLMERGADVFDVKDCPSPMLYHAVCQGKYDAGVNITASHNSAEYNGFKLVGREAHSICGDEIQTIKSMILDGDYEAVAAGLKEDTEITSDYCKKIKSLITINKKLKLVIDAGNGIAGKYYPSLFRELGCEVIELFCEQDGSFPNHEPDPVVEENTDELKLKVLETKAHLGISFDGDGDRLAIVDELGQYHDANETFVLLIRDILSRNYGSTVVHTVSNSLIVPEEIKKHGGFPRMVPVGHSFVEQAMTDSGALLGGEQSGHFFIAENYYSYDDAAFTAAKLLEIFSTAEAKVSEVYRSIPLVYAEQERRPFCADDRKFDVIESISKKLSKKYDCNTMDGVRVEFKDGSWMGLRASNTSPCLSLCMEARSPEELEKIKDLAQKTLKDHGVEI